MHIKYSYRRGFSCSADTGVKNSIPSNWEANAVDSSSCGAELAPVSRTLVHAVRNSIDVASLVNAYPTVMVEAAAPTRSAA